MKTFYKNLIIILFLSMSQSSVVTSQITGKTLTLDTTTATGNYVARDWISLNAGFSFTASAPTPAQGKIVHIRWDLSTIGKPNFTLNGQSYYGSEITEPGLNALIIAVTGLKLNLEVIYPISAGWTIYLMPNTYEEYVSLIIQHASSFEAGNPSNYYSLEVIQPYAPATAGTFEASIDEGLLFGLDYQEEQSGLDRDLDYTLPVGSSVGVFDVSSTGAGTYSIPITTPPGTAEMQPQLAITYSSQTGNGLLGLGWNIAGFSSITRSGRNYYYDSNADDIDFDSGDRFEMDGNRLVVISGTYGSNESVYYTSNEVFSKVTAYGTTGSGPQWFKVETKDGYIIEYGNTTDSRIEAQGRSDVVIWNINKIYDHRGNYMKFAYNEFNSTGEYYPKEIEYTGNTNTGLAPYNKIKFFYATKDDLSKAYIHGSAVQQSVLLYKINAYSDNTLSHQYEFKYSMDFYSHLNEIIEYGSENSRYNSTIVNWGTSSVPFSEATSFDNDDPNGNKFYFADFNGDGKDDFVRTPKKDHFTSTDKWELYLNQNGVTFTKSDEGNLSDWYVSHKGKDYFYRKNLGLRTVDFNGDGLDDIVWVEYHEILPNMPEYAEWAVYGDPPYYNYKHKVYLSDGQHLVYNAGLSLNFNQNNAQVIFGDFDGNSKTDLYAINEDDPLYPYEIYPIDFNGDGKTDIMAIKDDDCIIYDGNSSTELYHSGFPTKWHKVFPEDFNGDGKTDVLTWSTSGWQITYSKGDGFVWPQYSVSIMRNVNPDAGAYSIFLGDFNGDGKADIYETNFDWMFGMTYIYYSNGNDFTYDSFINIHDSDEEKNNIGDFNGDGIDECFYKENNSDPAIIISMRANEKKHLVHSITNGYNVTTDIGYKPLTDNSVYTKGSGAAFPVGDFKEALYVVSSVNTIDGIGGTRSINYTYEGAKLHKQGKGLLGFMKTTNVTTGISSTVNEFELLSNASYCTLLLKKQTVKNSSGDTISIVTNTNSIKDYGNKRIFPYVSSSVANDIQKNIATTTTYTYNPSDLTYGNPSSVIVNYNSDVAATTSNLYTSAGSWCPGKISSSTVTKTRTGESGSFLRAINYNYNSTTGLLESTVADPGKSKSVTTSYLYDLYGNVTNITTSAGGVGNREVTMVYDDKGRFVIQKINALDHTTTFTYENLYGMMVTSNDPNGNRVENRYDGFGGLKTTILPGGRVNQTSIGWVTNNNPSNARYYTASSGSGVPSSKTYFDALGRELKSETTGFGGEIIYTEKEYYSDGLLKRTTSPYKSGGTKLWTTYNYDTYKRMGSLVTPTCSTSYSYSSRTVTTTDCNGRSSSKTVNGAGDIVTSTDIGGSISYLYHPSGQVRQITAAGSVTSMTYDEYGMQTSLTDPDAGTTSYTYNALGELLTQTNARSQISTMTYDVLGRVATKSNPEGTVTFTYDNATKGIGMVASVSKSGHTVSYTYDELSRLKTETSTIEGTAYPTSYAYDNYIGKVSQVTYPSQFTVINEYDSCGYLKRVKRGDNGSLIWQGNSVNQYGQVTGATFGNNLTVTRGYDQYGFPSTIQTGTVQNMQFSFNTATGNLTWRKDNLSGRNFTESFTYDNLDRLTNCQIGASNYGTTYQNNGNIATKHDAGTYAYGTRPHAVTGLTGSPMSVTEQTITYNSFNQPVTLTQQAKNLAITYGVDEQRIKSVYTENSVNWTRKYLGNYEEVLVSGQVNKKIHYIAGGDGLAAVYIINGTTGTGEMYYVSTDYLSNILLLTRQNGTVAEEYSFDAWGRRRSPTNWNNYTVTAPGILYRGYTGHEHLDEFGLINMNGRCYDPILGRFLSPDNFVQMPDFTQNYNRYAYGLNNPLKYTDPSGNSLITTLIGLAVNYISQQLFSQPNTSNVSDVQQNRSSVIGMGVSAIVNNIIPGANGILKGIFSGGLSGGISGGLSAGIDAASSGDNFGDAFRAGFKSGAITGGVMGGVNGYFTAKAKNLNVWTGTPKRNDYLMMASYTLSEGDKLWGKMYVISNVSGDMNSMDGHSWIRLESANGKTTTTMSLWGNRGEQEFWTDLEINAGYGEVSKSRNITELQYSKIAKFNSVRSHINWTPWNTCAGYSARLWNYVTGDNLSARDWFFFTTPRDLSNSIIKNPH